MLINTKCIPGVVEALKTEDFYLEHNQALFDTMYAMFSHAETIDPVTVLEQMRQNGTYIEGTTRNYVAQLIDVTPTSANVMEYVKIVRDKALLRRIGETVDDIRGMVDRNEGSGQDILEAAEQRIYAIRQGRAARGLIPISQVLQDVYTRLEELALKEDHLPGLSTGLSDLDRAISGLNASDLILLAARPGMGKTSMALNILLNAGKKSGQSVVFFSLEMSREQLAMRLLSNEAFIDNKKLTTGNLDDEDWSKIALACAALNRTKILIDDNPMLTVADMLAKCRRVEDLGLICIDYLQLMQASGSGRSYAGENRQQVVSDISRSLKIMAKELQVPVLCLSQLSRANESRSDKRPMLSDLRESGAIEQDADIVMFLYRDDYYNPESEYRNQAECIIAKNRHGETGKIMLQWLPEFTTFSGLDWQHQE
jgi:replicative DNA helicase